ncbi:MAG: protein kinase domain-containing protein [Acidimicrobiales bacterium]
MAPESIHPGNFLLRDFAAGALAEEDLNRVAEHLGQCRRCRERVDRLSARDGFLGRLRTASSAVSETPERAGERRGAARALGRDTRQSSESRSELATEATSIPHEVGPYLILREVGRGGMGVVYQARHGELGRLVALKMILAGEFASEGQRQRFHREAELAARVQHPQIVQVYEVAVYQGRPYVVLEWCDGGSLADRVLSEGWPPHSAAGLVATLAEAIAAAHQCGVVHRDLKPSNILLKRSSEKVDAGPLRGVIPKIADFGLALALEHKSGLTSTGATLGTPEYMAPEQATGASVGPAADIYALGAMLYELLTGRAPFRAETALEVVQALKFEEPIAPHRLRPGLPRDLETIVLKALQKEPSKRYATAGAMAEDLRYFLDARPIRARPPNALDRLFKWTRRRPALAALSAVLVAVLLGAFGAITALWVDATKARDQATAAGTEARRQSALERRTHYQAGISAAASALELDYIDEARSLLEDLPEEHRNWEWRYLVGQLDNSTAVFRPAEGPVKAFDLAPDGKSFAYAVDGSSVLRLRRTAEPRDFARFDGLASAITSAAFSPDGARIAAGSADGTVRVWRIEGGVPVAAFEGQRSAITGVVFDHTASRLLLRNDQSEIQLWDLADDRRLALGRALDVRFSPDGKSISCRFNRGVRFLSSVDGRPVSQPDVAHRALEAVAFSPDGSRIATGALYPATDIVIHPFRGVAKVIVLEGHKNTINSVDFSPDGRQLASGSLDQTARIWDATTGSSLAVMHGHRAKLVAVQFASDGRRLLTRSEDHAIRLWETSDGALLGSLRGHAGVATIRLSRDGKFVGVADDRGTVRIWDLDRTIRRGVLGGHTSFVYDVAITVDGRWIASSSWDETVGFWDQGDGGRSAISRRLGGVVGSVTASPVGTRFATVERAGVLRLWEAPRTEPVWSVKFEAIPDDAVDGRVAFHPNESLLALSGGRDWAARFYDTATGEPLGGLHGDDRLTTDVAFSPEGETIATADTGGTLRLWDFTSRSPRAVIKAHDGFIFRLAFHPGGKMLASSSIDSSVRIWEIASGRLLATLKHVGHVYGIAFNPDGTRLATACKDNTIRLWDARHFEKVAELRGHQGYVHAVAFSADGTRLVSCSGDFTVRIWDAPKSANTRASTLGDPPVREALSNR